MGGGGAAGNLSGETREARTSLSSLRCFRRPQAPAYGRLESLVQEVPRCPAAAHGPPPHFALSSPMPVASMASSALISDSPATSPEAIGML